MTTHDYKWRNTPTKFPRSQRECGWSDDWPEAESEPWFKVAIICVAVAFVLLMVTK